MINRSRFLALGIAVIVIAYSTYLYLRLDWNQGAGKFDEVSASSGKATAKFTKAAKAGGKNGFDVNNRIQPVQVSAALQGDIDVVLTAIGSVSAKNTVTLRARVDGTLIKSYFREGQIVKKGSLLFLLDERPFKIALEQAKAQLMRDLAQLTQAKADLARYKILLTQDSIASQQVETQEALVQQLEGTVRSDQASVDNAALQLSFAGITAPISGRIGLKQVDVGNMVRSSDSSGLAVITETQPVYVVFALPAEKLGQAISLWLKGKELSVSVQDRNEKLPAVSGRLIAVDNQIDPSTGSIKLKAEFANKDNFLFPNQFVSARLKVETRKSILIPSNAVQQGSKGTFVYVVGKLKPVVEIRAISIGASTQEVVEVEKGLAIGELVVTDGADKLRSGAKVEIVNATTSQ